MPLRAPVDDGGARHLVRGLALPDVALPSTLGGTLNLSAQSGTAVIYFYTWTGRPGLGDPPGGDDIPARTARRRRRRAFATTTQLFGK